MQRKLKAVQGFLQQGVIFTVLALSHVLFLIWFKTAKSLNTELLTLKSSTYTKKIFMCGAKNFKQMLAFWTHYNFDTFFIMIRLHKKVVNWSFKGGFFAQIKDCGALSGRYHLTDDIEISTTLWIWNLK